MNQWPTLATSRTVDGICIIRVLMERVEVAEPTYALRDQIVALVSAAKPSQVVFDLADVRFIGSIGLLAFLGVRRHLPGARIVLCQMSTPVQNMFSICQLIPTERTKSTPFEAVATVDDALALLKQAEGR